MLDEKYIKIDELFCEIDAEGDLDSGLFKKFFNNGFRKLKLIVMADPNEAISSFNINKDLYNRIKDTQNLPETVVIDFLSIKGKLNKDRFNEEA